MVDAVASFVLYVGTGMIGASIYLLLMLITDHDLAVLKNNIITSISIMAALYIMAGGVFASIVQLSTGTLFAVSNLQTVLIMGFGWQGALSGVGVAKKVSAAKDEADQAGKQVAATIAQSKENEMDAIKAYYQQRLSELGAHQ